jgi:hypothetical protein
MKAATRIDRIGFTNEEVKLEPARLGDLVVVACSRSLGNRSRWSHSSWRCIPREAVALGVCRATELPTLGSARSGMDAPSNRDRQPMAAFFLSEMDNHQLKTWPDFHLRSPTHPSSPTVSQKRTFSLRDTSEGGQSGLPLIFEISRSEMGGLSIALRTATHSRNAMSECAHGRMVTLPVLFVRSRCRLLYTSQHSGSQRQVVLPNVFKFSQALIEIAGKYEDEKLKVHAVFCGFACLLIQPSGSVPTLPVGFTPPLLAYTTLHVSIRANSQASERLIPYSVFEKLITSASKVSAVFSCTSGKVGASNLWRNSTDEISVFTAESRLSRWNSRIGTFQGYFS